MKAKGLPLPPDLDPKLAREPVLKEYQTKRANLWRARYGHCSFNELKRIYVRSMKECLFTDADFKVEDIPKCEYCTVLKQDDRGPVTEKQQRLWQAARLTRPLGWDYRPGRGVQDTEFNFEDVFLQE